MVPLPVMPCSSRRRSNIRFDRVMLLAVNRSVLFQNTVDDPSVKGRQLRTLRWLDVADDPGGSEMPEHLPHRLARYAKPTCRLSLAQPIDMAGQPYA